MAVPYHTHEFTIPTASKEEVGEATISNKVVTPASLENIVDLVGTALQPGQAATPAQGTKADSALQPAAIGVTVASFAQGVKADSALQPAAIGTTVASYDLGTQKFDLSKWRLQTVIPQKFPDFDAMLIVAATTNYYPQGFWDDVTANERLVFFNPAADNGTGIVVAVYDLTTYAYKKCFSIGPGRGWGYTYYVSGVRYLVSTSGTVGAIGVWTITTLPANRAALSPSSTIAAATADAYVYGTYFNGTSTICSYGAPYGSTRQLTNYSQFDDAFNRIASLSLPSNIMGSLTGGTTTVGPATYYTGERANYPHVQGMADIGGNFLLQYGGGWFNDGSKGAGTLVQLYQGHRIVDAKGGVVAECLLRPDLLRTILIAQGLAVDRIEGEGCNFVNGKLISLFVTRATAAGASDGMVFVEVGAKGNGVFDVSPAQVRGKALRPNMVGQIPRINDKYFEDQSGVEFANLAAVLNTMVDRPEWTHAEFYSTYLKAGFTDINGASLPGSAQIHLDKMTDTTFYMRLITPGFGQQLYLINGGPSWVQTPLSPGFQAFLTANQTIATSNYTALNMNTEDYDYGGCYDAPTGVFTAPTAGKYLAILHLEYSAVAAAGENTGAVLWVNGSQGPFDIYPTVGTATQTRQVQRILSLSTGNTVAAYHYAAAATSKTIQSSSIRTWFSIVRLQ